MDNHLIKKILMNECNYLAISQLNKNQQVPKQVKKDNAKLLRLITSLINVLV